MSILNHLQLWDVLGYTMQDATSEAQNLLQMDFSAS